MPAKRRVVDLSPDADALFATLAAWQQDHPRATLTEIEDAVDTELATLRQRIVEAQIDAHALADEVASPDDHRCSACGGRLRSHGTHGRRLTTRQGGAIDLERTYWWCPRCRAGFSPPG